MEQHHGKAHNFVGLPELQAAADAYPELVAKCEPFRYAVELTPGSVRITRSSKVQNSLKPEGYKARTEINGWSAKSRSNMVSRMCSLDYQAMLGQPDRTPCLITLTYPGNWQAVVPDGESAMRHLKLFRARYERRWGEPLRAVWKMEFQRRGACHFHLFTSIPNRPGFAEWLSQAWTDIVAPDDADEREKHLAAGTGLDYNTGVRANNPKRVAVYFAKHNSPNHGAKEYQNQPPAEWLAAGSVGRFWGYWNTKPLTVRIPIGEDEALLAARILRRWTTANSKPVRYKVERVCQRTGVISERWVTRRKPTRMRSRLGFVSVDDGAAIGSKLADAIRTSVGWEK
jgi:hypothetical protein